MAEEMKILQKIFDMMDYAYPVLAQYPKSEKFALVTDIKREMNLILKYAITAKKKYYKKTTLQEEFAHKSNFRFMCEFFCISFEHCFVWKRCEDLYLVTRMPRYF